MKVRASQDIMDFCYHRGLVLGQFKPGSNNRLHTI